VSVCKWGVVLPTASAVWLGRNAFGSRGIDKREAPNSQLSKPSSEAKSDSCPADPR
jgi:hypothetical protein